MAGVDPSAEGAGRHAAGGGALKTRLSEEMKEALKARDRVRLAALRMLAASVTNREVELRHPLTDEEFVEVAAREVKRRKEAIESFEHAGRADRAEVERQEMVALQRYVPASLTDEEVAALVEEAIGATGASGPRDLGRVMGHVMARAKGRVDGKIVQALVRERLGG